MVLVFGDQNVGKSFCMVHFGKVALMQRKFVVHITLETSKDIIMNRYASAFPSRVIPNSSYDLLDKENLLLANGQNFKLRKMNQKILDKKVAFLHRIGAQLHLHQATNFSFKDFVALIDMLELQYERVPDLVIIDSPDQMKFDTKYKEYRHAERELYQDLLDFSKDRCCTLVVTTQAGRQASKKELTKGADVAESYDKVRIVDTVLTLNQTEEEQSKGLLRLLHYKSMSCAKYHLIEIVQALPVGQFCMEAKMLSRKIGVKVANEIASSLGV
jgi:KaiC/GvpD/RAD55 family RecA-like ATPase